MAFLNTRTRASANTAGMAAGSLKAIDDGQQHDILGAAAPDLVHHAQRESVARSEEHTSELQSLMRISYAVFCLKKKNKKNNKRTKRENELKTKDITQDDTRKQRKNK